MEWGRGAALTEGLLLAEGKEQGDRRPKRGSVTAKRPSFRGRSGSVGQVTQLGPTRAPDRCKVLILVGPHP